MTRPPRRTAARSLARPVVDLRWAALAAAALAGVYGATGTFQTGATAAAVGGR